jgi:hypothetical protein
MHEFDANLLLTLNLLTKNTPDEIVESREFMRMEALVGNLAG